MILVYYESFTFAMNDILFLINLLTEQNKKRLCMFQQWQK